MWSAAVGRPHQCHVSLEIDTASVNYDSARAHSIRRNIEIEISHVNLLSAVWQGLVAYTVCELWPLQSLQRPAMDVRLAGTELCTNLWKE